MVPSDYRLDRVCARLVDRLEAARRSYAGHPERAESELARVAEEEVEAAILEYREVALADHPEVQGAFLRREVLRTFLPRYLHLATDMTEAEEEDYGLGPLADPVGRLLLLGVGIVTVAFLWRFARWPIAWPLFAAAALLPFASELVAWWHTRRYRRRLEGLVSDMGRLQELSATYLRPDQLLADPLETPEPTRPEDDP